MTKLYLNLYFPLTLLILVILIAVLHKLILSAANFRNHIIITAYLIMSIVTLLRQVPDRRKGVAVLVFVH